MKIIFAFYCLFLCYSCRHNGNNVKVVGDQGEIMMIRPMTDEHVDMNNVDTIMFKISEDRPATMTNVGSTRIVPLETNNQSLIGSIQRIICYKDKIYILNDAGENGSIMVFDTNGHFNAKIEKHGRGPGEYIKLGDFDIDDYGNIYISDMMRTDKLLVYNSNLQYKRTITLESSIYSFGVFNGNIWGYTAMSDYKNNHKYILLVMDKNGKVNHKFFPFKSTWKGQLYTNRTAFTKNKGRLYINLPFTDIIYSADSLNNVRGEYCLQYQGKKSTGEYVNCFKEDMFKSFYPLGNKIMIQTTSLPGDLHKYSSFLLGFYDKCGNKIDFIDTWDLKNDFAKDILTFPWAGFVRGFLNDSIVIHPMESLSCLNIYKHNNDSFDRISEYNKNIINNLDEDDNPVLFFNSIR